MGLTKRMIEEAEARLFWPSGATVCRVHVRDEYLLAQQPDVSTLGLCAVCGAAERHQIDLDELQDRVVSVIRHYRRRAIDELYHDSETETGYALPDAWIEDTADVVGDLFDDALDDELRESVANSIEHELWFRPGLIWLEGTELYLESWRGFRRLLCRDDVSLDQLLKGALDDERWTQQTADGLQPSQLLPALLDVIAELGVLKTVAPSTTWFRAVRVPVGQRLTAARLGTAPLACAVANRMNRADAPMFYGARDAETAAAEVGQAPARGTTVVAAWRPSRPLQVLDLVDMGAPPHLYDIERAGLRWRHLFLADFALDVSRPVGSHEKLAYQPTQVFMEYLRSRVDGLDGIVYRSSITGEPCCALDVDNAACVSAAAVGGRGKGITMILEDWKTVP